MKRFAALIIALSVGCDAPPSSTTPSQSTVTPKAQTSAGAVSKPAESSVRPGLNDPFFDAKQDVGTWAKRWEVEGREVYDAHRAIVKAVALEPGMAVADIGAGTGLFVAPFAEAVGPKGRVYALDIVDKFVAHVKERAKDLPQVEARLTKPRSIGLPAGSIDKAFVCDTYHHFEFPQTVLASIHRALRDDGELIVIEFDKIEGTSRDWIMKHVRADRATFSAEIEAAGFKLSASPAVEGLKENYFLRFSKASDKRTK